jgi:hypothetical protein
VVARGVKESPNLYGDCYRSTYLIHFKFRREKIIFRFIWSALTASPVVSGTSFLVANSTFAAQSFNIEPVCVGVEEPPLTDLTPSEISLPQDFANQTLDEPQLSSETTTAESRSEDVELVNDDSPFTLFLQVQSNSARLADPSTVTLTAKFSWAKALFFGG